MSITEEWKWQMTILIKVKYKNEFSYTTSKCWNINLLIWPNDVCILFLLCFHKLILSVNKTGIFLSLFYDKRLPQRVFLLVKKTITRLVIRHWSNSRISRNVSKIRFTKVDIMSRLYTFLRESWQSHIVDVQEVTRCVYLCTRSCEIFKQLSIWCRIWCIAFEFFFYSAAQPDH